MIFTYVTPATNISIVFALIKPDNVRRKIVVKMRMVRMRSPRLLNPLQITIGANKRKMIKGMSSARADPFSKELEKTCTCGSCEISW